MIGFTQNSNIKRTIAVSAAILRTPQTALSGPSIWAASLTHLSISRSVLILCNMYSVVIPCLEFLGVVAEEEPTDGSAGGEGDLLL
jgi:hypothetical protein